VQLLLRCQVDADNHLLSGVSAADLPLLLSAVCVMTTMERMSKKLAVQCQDYVH